MAGQHHAEDYRPDIDGLRAVAVLAAIGYHAAPGYLRGGFVGVDVFFVISGYLICGIILGGLRNGTFSLAEFYGRRIRRIFPALILVLAVSGRSAGTRKFQTISQTSAGTSLPAPGSTRTS